MKNNFSSLTLDDERGCGCGGAGPVAGGADEAALVRPPHPPQAEVPAEDADGGPAPAGQG